MNASARTHALIIGIGNPLRSDDGLGWVVAERLARDSEEGWAIHTVHQLTPDLAQWMAEAEMVVMVDASRKGEPGAVCVRPISPSTQLGAAGTHDTTPEELAALTAAVYGHCPPVVMVSMTGANFSIGEHLSSVVARRIPLVSEVVHQVCTAILHGKKKPESLSLQAKTGM
jgi:hydrogenase maturation protease